MCGAWKEQALQERRVGDEARAQTEACQNAPYLRLLREIVTLVSLGHRPRYRHRNCCVCEKLKKLTKEFHDKHD